MWDARYHGFVRPTAGGDLRASSISGGCEKFPEIYRCPQKKSRRNRQEKSTALGEKMCAPPKVDCRSLRASSAACSAESCTILLRAFDPGAGSHAAHHTSRTTPTRSIGPCGAMSQRSGSIAALATESARRRHLSFRLVCRCCANETLVIVVPGPSRSLLLLGRLTVELLLVLTPTTTRSP